jgi:Recombination endonuclease VII
MNINAIRNSNGRFIPVSIDPTITTRTCGGCHQEKPLELFPADKKGLLGRRGRCKKCSSDDVNRYNKRNRDKVRKIGRKCGLKKYGVTVEEYDAIFASQGNLCAICKSDKSHGRSRTFPVDHCHNSSVVRGILCNRCNMMLGYCLDNPEVLRAAADYLIEFEDGWRVVTSRNALRKVRP